MKTIKILRSKVNDNVTTYTEGMTQFNKDYWKLLLLEVKDDYDEMSDDFTEYYDQIKELYDEV